MDFGSLLHVAKKNSQHNGSSSSQHFYSTKFAPPKKEARDKKLSANIQKFLAKKEEEEKEKARLAKQKLDELLALRDTKAKNKIKKMLKVTKSANRSVLEDAVDTQNTALTLQGPEQPDEDDYGYTSQEASLLYRKLMDKYKAIPEEKKFSNSSQKPLSKQEMLNTKDRVRAAIEREKEEEQNPHRRSKQHTESTVPKSDNKSSSSQPRRRANLYDPDAEKEEEDRQRKEEQREKIKSRKPAAPPVLDFRKLLELAEKKQHEPLEIEVIPVKKKEPERLLTNKEKRELEERRLFFEEKEKRKMSKNRPNETIVKPPVTDRPKPNKMEPNGRIPKLNGSMQSNSTKTVVSKPTATIPDKRININSPDERNRSKPPSSSVPQNRPVQQSERTGSSKPSSSGLKTSSVKPINSKSNGLDKNPIKSSKIDGKTRDFPPKDVVRKMVTTEPMKRPTGEIKPRQLPPVEMKGRPFPPVDVNRKYSPSASRPNPTSNRMKKPPMKRRIINDDDSEYDSEMDDFIDDAPQENDYSKHIKEIFGYDKSRYRNLDEDVDNMETSFAQQMKEEFISKKIGLLEDLEDMRMEAEEKKRKSKMKKRRLSDD